MAYTKARFESFCFECKSKVFVNQIVFLSKYLDKDSGKYQNAWKHADCVTEEELRKLNMKPSEFICKNCFLYKNLSQLSDEGENICSDC